MTTTFLNDFQLQFWYIDFTQSVLLYKVKCVEHNQCPKQCS